MARIVSPTMPPPLSVEIGDVWFHTLSGLTFEWQHTAGGAAVWVQVLLPGQSPVPQLAPTIDNLTPKCSSSALAPDNPDPCDLWFHTETGVFFIYYDDGNTRQWVTTQPTKVGDIIVVTGPAGGDLAGSYPNPTIKPDVVLTGDPKSTTPPTADNDTSIATTAWVRLQGYAPTSQGVPAGGTTGQYLVKSSNVDFATQWQTLPSF